MEKHIFLTKKNYNKFKKEWKKKIYLDKNEIKEEGLRKLNEDFKKNGNFL